MLSRKSFFSFVELAEPSRHRQYNAYHQLDHRPENLALGGVIWGDRWVRTPEDAAASTVAIDPLAGVQYVAMYWFADPVEHSVAEWQELGERAFQWGRKPDTDWSRRKVGFFVPLQGYASRRIRVSADALPFRPVRGMHIVVSRVHEPHSAATEEAYSWYDRVRIPDLLDCDGVAGAWTFYSEWNTLVPAESRDSPGHIRITLLYLDEHPDVFIADRARRTKRWEKSRRLLDTSDVETVLLDSALRPIEPWSWGWFEADGAGS